MESKFIDTNIFIEVFIRLGDKSKKSKKLIRSINNLYTNLLVISEVVWVLDSVYELDRGTVTKCIKSILSTKIVIENKKELVSSINFYESNNVDWTDCLNMFLLKNENISTVYSYDKGLNNFDWIKRLEP
ncbi:MAG: PIN domain-containing protein [Patescibacteria group bacterium]